jgi:two-component system, NarL family, response regulator NreC
MTNQTVLIAEDHAILREGLRALLSSAPDLEIVGEAGDGEEAASRARQLNPDIVLMDLSMPNINGTEAIRAIKRRNPEIKVIALTVHKSEEYVRASLDAGADGYVLKDDTHHDLLTAIASVQKGKIYLSPGICDKVISGYLDRSATAPSPHTWTSLTEREREVLKLIAEGMKSREVAEYLSLSLKTVEKHRSNLMKKLDLHSVSALTTYAIENNLVKL